MRSIYVYVLCFRQFIITGNLLSPTELLGNLAQIVNDTAKKAEYPLGVLTCQNRDEWAKQRTHLEETGNLEALKKIDSAIFNLVLDDEIINDNKHKILSEFLHADGTNRYYTGFYFLELSFHFFFMFIIIRFCSVLYDTKLFFKLLLL